MNILTVKDETFSGEVLNNLTLEFKNEIVSIKEIIEERVLLEVELYNAKLPEYYNGLVIPTNAEKTLNGYKIRDKKQIDAEKQIYTALDAFQKNRFFVLVDDVQSESLDQMVTLKKNTVVSFLKLTPLVGG